MRTIFMVLDLPQLISFSSCVLCQLPPSQKLPCCFLIAPHLLSTLQHSARGYQTTFVSWLLFKLRPFRHIYTIAFDAQLLHPHLQQLSPCSRVTEASKPPPWNSV
ncbi:hypothetical protein FVEN_g11994 [Fusarium venenatum]|nr:hypothetical protein FVEN_g11994 [Fusarium venenatum]